MLRKTLMVAGLCLLCPCLAVYTAQAALERGLLEAASSALDFPESWMSGQPRVVVLNGARVHILTGRSELSKSALLDHVQAGCRAQASGLVALVAEAKERAPSSLPGVLDGVLRAENGQEGVVACLQLGAHEMSMDELLDRVDRFTDELDLDELGGVRMVRVSAREHGSFFVVAMSEGSAALTKMFPDDGDAPGVDFPSLPRPEGAVRILSAWQVDGEPALSAYKVSRAPDDAWSRQLEIMAEHGWEPAADNAHESRNSHAALFWRAGKTALVVAQADGVETLLSLMPLDSGPGAVRVH